MSIYRNKISSKNFIGIALSICFIASFFLFLTIIKSLDTDIELHADILIKARNYPPNFLYYFAIDLFSFFSKQEKFLYLASAFALSLAVTLKLYFTYQIINDRLNIKNIHKAFLAFCMLIVFSLPNISYFLNHQYYLGQITPNVWHNSTTIFAFPFALLLFWKSFLYIESPERTKLINIFLLIVLNIIIKPSFFFIFAIGFPLFTLYKLGWSKYFWKVSIIVSIGILFIFFQYLLIYKLGIGYERINNERDKIALMPFVVWKTYTGNYWFMITAFLTSLAFPVFSALLSLKKLIRSDFWIYSVILQFIAIVLFILLAESGPRIVHGNFYWQCVFASYILFLTTLINLFQLSIKKNQKRFLLLIFSGHVLSGVVYFVKMIAFHSYG